MVWCKLDFFGLGFCLCCFFFVVNFFRLLLKVFGNIREKLLVIFDCRGRKDDDYFCFSWFGLGIFLGREYGGCFLILLRFDEFWDRGGEGLIFIFINWDCFVVLD